VCQKRLAAAKSSVADRLLAAFALLDGFCFEVGTRFKSINWFKRGPDRHAKPPKA